MFSVLLCRMVFAVVFRIIQPSFRMPGAENGQKNTAAKQLPFMAASCGCHICESFFRRHTEAGEAPLTRSARIQLAESILI